MEKAMSAKSSTSTTDKQDAFREKMDGETVSTEALRDLLQRRLEEPLITSIEMGDRVNAMIERKRRSL